MKEGVHSVDVDGDSMQDFILWLCSHEDDIKHGVNDFWQLREFFRQFVGRDAGESVTKDVW